MASTSAEPRPVTAPEADPGTTGEVTGCLGGTVHLAYAQASPAAPAVIAAGFSAYAALTRARARADALGLLHRLPAGSDPVSGSGPVPGLGGRRLRLTDFVPGTPEDGPVVAGTGLLTGDRYLLPAEVCRLGEGDGMVEPTEVGVVDNGVSAAVAELLAHDVVTRWWADPRRRILRVSRYLDRLLPPGVVEAASGLGLWVSAFVLPAPDARVALVGVGGEGTAMAAAAARTVKEAVGEAFLRAMASRAQPWDELPAGDSLRRLVVWHREADYLAYLESSAVDTGPRLLGEPGGLRPSNWADVASRRFGHEPVAVTAGPSRQVVKVVCPGAACHRPLPPGTALPCPVN
ncbi:hypothetical protein ACFYSC_21815 [Streptosporangium sp. NPDC004379]|uniref:hypothetical protein n=1 Tax=Streptosporangium sp. NPDC004379 TaxID=3366189 RepID=UPI0036B83BC4